MKLRTVSATFALAAALGLGLSTPARAQTADPCSVFLCMASVTAPGGSATPQCAAPIAAFHVIQIWSPHFNPSATAAARRSYLMTCTGVTTNPTNQAMLQSIIAAWGYTP